MQGMRGIDGSDVELDGPVGLRVINACCPLTLFEEVKTAGEGKVHAKLAPRAFGHRTTKGSLVAPVHVNGEQTLDELISSIYSQVSGMAGVPLKLVALFIGDVRYVSPAEEECNEDDIPNPVFVERKKKRHSAHNNIR